MLALHMWNSYGWVSSGGMCVSMTTVLVGCKFCNWYDQQGEPSPITIRDIARLIYPTQCSKNPSGVMIPQF